MFVVLVSLPACNEDDEHPNEYVNNWIEVNMDFWYYWNTDLPSKPDKTWFLMNFLRVYY